MPEPTIDAYRFETGVYRPPSEGGSNSLLVRLTRNCPWNRCTFCAMYKREKFEVRSPDDIKRDIDAMAAIVADLAKISSELGHHGAIAQEAAIELINRVPQLNYHDGFVMLYHWLLSGSRTAFLQDANSIIMKTGGLVDVLEYLRQTFPSITRITSYARSKTLMQKPADDLTAIRRAGLDRLHVGLETGDDELLRMIKKGVTADGHIKGGQKALAAGFQLSEYWMPGLGGKAMRENHALNTARVLNEINPHYIRSRPFHPLPGTPLQAQIQNRAFEFGKLIQEKYPVMGQGDLPGLGIGTPADKGDIRNCVMRASKGPLGHDAAFFERSTSHAMYLGRFECFAYAKWWKDTGKAFGQHGLSRTGWADQNNVMPTCRGDLHTAFNTLLPFYIGKIVL